MVFDAVQVLTETISEPPARLTYVRHGAALADDCIYDVPGHTGETLFDGEGGLRECDGPGLGNIRTGVASRTIATDSTRMNGNVGPKMTPDQKIPEVLIDP